MELQQQTEVLIQDLLVVPVRQGVVILGQAVQVAVHQKVLIQDLLVVPVHQGVVIRAQAVQVAVHQEAVIQDLRALQVLPEVVTPGHQAHHQEAVIQVLRVEAAIVLHLQAGVLHLDLPDLALLQEVVVHLHHQEEDKNMINL
jgi:hypothetical protein